MLLKKKYDDQKHIKQEVYISFSLLFVLRWRVYTDFERDYHTFASRQVAKCEPNKEQSIESEEQFWDTIVVNWRTYKAI